MPKMQFIPHEQKADKKKTADSESLPIKQKSSASAKPKEADKK